jgi:multiple sugar transport system ATP-binding protein
VDVTFKHVTLTYPNGVEVLHDMDFQIPDGQLIALLGPSGGGKSTTLNLISGLLQATSGQIKFGDQDVTKLDALQRGVGMVFQNYALYPHMTVLENIMFPMKMAKVAKNERKERALALAKLVRVDDQIDKKPGALSGGQQQRVAIARALAKQPSILLLDEPLSNLDARLRVEMREEIRRIQQETHITTIFVTHDQSEAMHVADQIMLLNDGVIQQYAAPQALYNEPNNQFVASFIGEPALNVLPADVLRESLYQVFGTRTQLIEKVGIRAEAITLGGTTQAAIQLPLTVSRVTAYGRDFNAKVNVAGHEVMSTAIDGSAPLNTELTAHVLLAGLYAFDPVGKRVYPEGGVQ